jgi:hypothetical protein
VKRETVMSITDPPIAAPARRNLWLLIAQMAVASGLFWGIVRLVDYFDWDQGTNRALILGLVFLATPILVRLVRRSSDGAPGALSIVLALACLALIGWHFFYFAQRFPEPHVIDIATTTLAAVDALRSGQNPYSLPVDPPAWAPGGPFSFNGYKYLPMMAVTFLPLGAVWRESGLLATNLLLDLAVVVLLFLLGSRLGTRVVGLFAAFLYLTLPVVPFEIFEQGVTDLAAVVPLLLALLCLEKRPLLAGLLVGLSLSTKLVPGSLFVLCCLPYVERRRYLAGVAAGVAPILLFLALSPVDLIANTVLFNFQRPSDTTSWMYGLSPAVSSLARLACLAILLGAGVLVWLRDLTLAQRCGLVTLCVLGVILTGPVSHRNYQLWWLPLFAVLTGAAAFWQPIGKDLPKEL